MIAVLLAATAFAGPWVSWAPSIGAFTRPADEWAPAFGPGVESAVGERHGFELRARVWVPLSTELQASALGTIELVWLPELMDEWRLGPVLAFDWDSLACQGTVPPFCDGAAFLISARRGEPRAASRDQLDLALGTELSRALGDRLTLRPRARVSYRHRTGITGAADAGLHFQTMLLRLELGYTFMLGSRDEP